MKAGSSAKGTLSSKRKSMIPIYAELKLVEVMSGFLIKGFFFWMWWWGKAHKIHNYT